MSFLALSSRSCGPLTSSCELHSSSLGSVAENRTGLGGPREAADDFLELPCKSPFQRAWEGRGQRAGQVREGFHSSEFQTCHPALIAVTWTDASVTQVTFSLFANSILSSHDLGTLGLVSVMLCFVRLRLCGIQDLVP